MRIIYSFPIQINKRASLKFVLSKITRHLKKSGEYTSENTNKKQNKNNMKMKILIWKNY